MVPLPWPALREPLAWSGSVCGGLQPPVHSATPQEGAQESKEQRKVILKFRHPTKLPPVLARAKTTLARITFSYNVSACCKDVSHLPHCPSNIIGKAIMERNLYKFIYQYTMQKSSKNLCAEYQLGFV